MISGPGLASAPLARAVLARWSWRPAAAQGTQGLLGGLAVRGAPMLERARGLQAWHDGLARRWRPADSVPPAPTGGGGGPAAAAGITALPGAAAAATRVRELPGAPRRQGRERGGLAPVRISPVSGAGLRVQRLPATAPAPARPALTITALAAPAATAVAPLPVTFRSSTPVAAAGARAGGPVLVPAIGRRFARREVAGGFPEAPSRGPAGGARAAARPTAALVPWRAVEGRPADARPRASDGDAGLQIAPALPAPALPAFRTDQPPDAGLVERPGAAEAIALPGLSVRLVAPEEAARRLAQGDDAEGPRGARSEAGARRESSPATAKAAIDIDVIVERVQRELKRRERFERERKGLL